MNNSPIPTQIIKVSGMRPLLGAQFLSAFGDNALLFATLALMKQQLYPDWTQPILQIVFVVAYIVLAPFVGLFADRFAKGRVMMLANGLKLLGALTIALQINPLVGYGIVGVGAAAYSPAKYGILGELLQKPQLVKGNGLIEALTIAAILLGSVAGGFFADWNVEASLLICVLFYGLAVVANLFIPKLPAARPSSGWQPRRAWQQFTAACIELWCDKPCRFSLIGTSLFWAAGVTLRFLLVIWVPLALGIADNLTPTLLNGMVAIGIVFGAGAAAKFITLEQASKVLPAGIMVGIVVIGFALQTDLFPAYLLLILLGAAGGLFVVPLNALLQERGRETIGTGNAIAVQNLGENSGMLIMLGLYSFAVWLGASAIAVGVAFGVLFALAITGLWYWQHRDS